MVDVARDLLFCYFPFLPAGRVLTHITLNYPVFSRGSYIFSRTRAEQCARAQVNGLVGVPRRPSKIYETLIEEGYRDEEVPQWFLRPGQDPQRKARTPSDASEIPSEPLRPHVKDQETPPYRTGTLRSEGEGLEGLEPLGGSVEPLGGSVEPRGGSVEPRGGYRSDI